MKAAEAKEACTEGKELQENNMGNEADALREIILDFEQRLADVQVSPQQSLCNQCSSSHLIDL